MVDTFCMALGHRTNSKSKRPCALFRSASVTKGTSCKQCKYSRSLLFGGKISPKDKRDYFAGIGVPLYVPQRKLTELEDA